MVATPIKDLFDKETLTREDDEKESELIQKYGNPYLRLSDFINHVLLSINSQLSAVSIFCRFVENYGLIIYDNDTLVSTTQLLESLTCRETQCSIDADNLEFWATLKNERNYHVRIDDVARAYYLRGNETFDWYNGWIDGKVIQLAIPDEIKADVNQSSVDVIYDDIEGELEPYGEPELLPSDAINFYQAKNLLGNDWTAEEFAIQVIHGSIRLFEKSNNDTEKLRPFTNNADAVLMNHYETEFFPFDSDSIEKALLDFKYSKPELLKFKPECRYISFNNACELVAKSTGDIKKAEVYLMSRLERGVIYAIHPTGWFPPRHSLNGERWRSGYFNKSKLKQLIADEFDDIETPQSATETIEQRNHKPDWTAEGENSSVMGRKNKIQQEKLEYTNLEGFLYMFNYSTTEETDSIDSMLEQFNWILDKDIPLRFSEEGYVYDDKLAHKGDVKCELIRIKKGKGSFDREVKTKNELSIPLGKLLIKRSDIKAVYLKDGETRYPWTLVALPKIPQCPSDWAWFTTDGKLEPQVHEYNDIPPKDETMNNVIEKQTTNKPISQKDNLINELYLLHLSDLHISNQDEATKYIAQLNTDLLNELKIPKLDYLILSGDIGNRATTEEYQAAVSFIDGLIKQFPISREKIIITTGNHDVSYELSKNEGYKFEHSLPAGLSEDKYIEAGNVGYLIRQEEGYKQRFKYFNEDFYKPVTNSDYPLDFKDQAILHRDEENKLLFLTLNSAWEIDHKRENRASIHSTALAMAISKIHEGNYQDWLKIAVWHHPIIGKEPMNDDFLQQLVTNDFKLCMHGHIHEAKNAVYSYDDNRGLRIIAAGTFGAPANQQVTGIPLQYNLLKWDKQAQNIIVQTRKKEQVDGAWKADARWGDSNNPTSSYQIDLSKK